MYTFHWLLLLLLLFIDDIIIAQTFSLTCSNNLIVYYSHTMTIP